MCNRLARRRLNPAAAHQWRRFRLRPPHRLKRSAPDLSHRRNLRLRLSNKRRQTCCLRSPTRAARFQGSSPTCLAGTTAVNHRRSPHSQQRQPDRRCRAVLRRKSPLRSHSAHRATRSQPLRHQQLLNRHLSHQQRLQHQARQHLRAASRSPAPQAADTVCRLHPCAHAPKPTASLKL